MRILILSWRDPRNPKAGGAELFTHEVARRMVARGDAVEWFVAGHPGAPPEEDLDGIHVVRSGRQWSVHLAAARHYRGKLEGKFDAVIDEVNTIPFFTPLWAPIPRLLLIFQLAREVWWYEAPFPVNAAGYAVEPLYLRIYRRTPAMTISNSTRDDLRRLGFTAPITVLPIGLEPMTVPGVPKEQAFTFLYVGRMAPSKRVHDIIEAFSEFQKQAGPARLWLVGDGTEKYLRTLRGLIRKRGLEGVVDLLGRVSAEEKHRRMTAAHVLLMASAREGWGLSVAEAAACGTPSIVYDVPGLRDAVRSGETGLVVPAEPVRMAQAMVTLAADPDLYRRLAAEGRRWSAEFSFDAAAESVGAVIAATIAGVGRVSDSPPAVTSP